MILVTGATGHLGKATIDFLLQKGISPDNISALARSAEKATDLQTKGINVVIGNYDDYASLSAAFNGVDKLLFICKQPSKYIFFQVICGHTLVGK